VEAVVGVLLFAGAAEGLVPVYCLDVLHQNFAADFYSDTFLHIE